MFHLSPHLVSSKEGAALLVQECRAAPPKPMKWAEAALPATATPHPEPRGEAGAGLAGRDASGAPAAREAPFLPLCSDIQSPWVPAGVTAVKDKNLIFK